jgi:hypothetical protein
MKASAKPKPAPRLVELELDVRYLAWICAGKKHMITRRGLLHFHSGDVIGMRAGDVVLRLEVTGAHFRTLDSLTERDAELEGFSSVAEMQVALLQHYWDLRPADLLTCIRFKGKTL